MRTSRPLPRRLAPAVAGVVAAVGLAGCGGTEATTEATSSRAELAGAVPASAVAFAQATVKPEGGERAGVEELARRVGGVKDPAAELVRALDSGGGPTWSRDVKPAIGQEVAAWAGKPQGERPVAALVAQVQDKAAAERLVTRGGELTERAEVAGTPYRKAARQDLAAWVGDDLAAIGTEAGVRATIQARRGPTLDGSRPFAATVRLLPGGEDLVVGYAESRGALEALEAAQPEGATPAPVPGLGRFGDPEASLDAAREALQREGAGPVGFTVQPQPGRLTFASVEARSRPPRVDPSEAAQALASAPDGAFLAAGLPDVGESIGTTLQQGGGTAEVQRQVRRLTGLDLQRDLLRWMGTGALFVRGSGLADVGGGVAVQAKDPRAARRAIEQLGSRLRARGATVSPNAVPGADLAIGISGLAPTPVLAALRGDRVVIGVNAEAVRGALGGGPTLGRSSGYQQARRALGGTAPSFLLDGARARGLLDTASQFGADRDPQARRALAGARRIQLIASGATVRGTQVRTQGVLVYR